MPTNISPLVYVNGIALPPSSTYSANTATLVDSARNAEGKMVGSVIRDNVAKIELTWNFLSNEDWANILAKFTGSFENDVRFFDQATAGWVTKKMYVSDRNASIPFCDPRTGLPRGWIGARLSLIES